MKNWTGCFVEHGYLIKAAHRGGQIRIQPSLNLFRVNKNNDIRKSLCRIELAFCSGELTVERASGGRLLSQLKSAARVTYFQQTPFLYLTKSHIFNKRPNVFVYFLIHIFPTKDRLYLFGAEFTYLFCVEKSVALNVAVEQNDKYQV